ncbi:glycosyltransferase/N-acetylglucosaminyl transferase [Streptomyces albus]|uniref:Glycosyltransferase/N-acetylglucosaminyl transferase n=2 Tax=Streptomyces albus TaxID=1888 RepID=A0A0B5EG10_STRA4|nr:glycosyltransferase/N-acetylglucosaminyl transferase [Streptomyces albus]AOU75275.1 glycosyltransferase/N-acetylglucosaminyl transferase [Streptomyces albus]AYN31080.1 glycosyltransferase/N-acetylglucosaminyl transferase [Streptomyces albus]
MPTPAWEVEPTGERRRLVHVNATARGGGVAELLHGLVPCQQAAGLNAGWAVIGGDEDFYAVTKLLHHLLHGTADPDRLRAESLRTYRERLAAQASWFTERLTRDDVVVLHDPQTLGLAPLLSATGARVVWHCHVGADVPPDRGPGAVWRAFAAELSAVDAVITTLPEFAPPSVPLARRFVAAPAIDPSAPKNRHLEPREVAALLDRAGLTADRTAPDVRLVQQTTLPADARVVLQVSRWDPLKDMPGVVRCLAGLAPDVHLVLAGTDPTEIPDDPEGLAVLADVQQTLAGLAPADRARVHLVNVSMRDPLGNALLVNALQRRADVVLQKSLEEGFGLTVTEAMVKGRAVVASSVGGLRQQVIHERNGLLVEPTDLAGVRAALTRLLDDPALRRRLGEQARNDTLERYTMTRLVTDYGAIAGSAEGALA